MIPIKRKNSTQTIGEVQKNNIEIDASNLDFIVSLLTTNLYKKPLESAIRELVSNAVDSHKEAGIENPVIILIEDDVADGDYTLTIKDFGTGISEERFNKVYRYLGSSTKRESNKFIGMYGIGKFSPLAYTDTVLIKSVFDYVEYSYMMYKNGNKIQIDLLSKKDTNENNGLEVSFNVKAEDLYELREAIRKLVLIPDIYLQDETNGNVINFTDTFNSRKINTYNLFKTTNFCKESYYSSWETNINVAIGNILYEINMQNIPGFNGFKDIFLNNIPKKLILSFNIGELETSPSREDILYNKNNIEVISNKLKAVTNFFKEKANKKLKPNYTNILEYIRNYESVEIMINDYTTERIVVDNFIKYKRKNINLEDIISAINSYNIKNISAYNRNIYEGYGRLDSFKAKKYKIDYILRYILTSSKGYLHGKYGLLEENFNIFYINRSLTQLDKKYLFSIRKDFDIDKKYVFSDYVPYYKLLKEIAIKGYLNREHKRFIYDLLKYKLSKVKEYDYEKELTPEVKKELKLLYPTKRKSANKTVTNNDGKINKKKKHNQIGFFELNKSEYRWNYYIYSKSKFHVIKDIRKIYKKKVIYIINGENDYIFKELYSYLNSMYAFIKVFKHDAKYLKNEKGFVYFSDFLKNKDSRPKLNRLVNLLKTYQDSETLKNSSWKNIKKLEPINKIQNMFYSLPYNLKTNRSNLISLVEDYFTNIWDTDIEILELKKLIKSNRKIVETINKIEYIEAYSSIYSKLTIFKSLKLALIKPNYYLQLKKEYYDKFKN